jgi:methionyl-tRNA synthetase
MNESEFLQFEIDNHGRTTKQINKERVETFWEKCNKI